MTHILEICYTDNKCNASQTSMTVPKLSKQAQMCVTTLASNFLTHDAKKEYKVNLKM